MATIVVVSFFFEKRRSLATAVCVCGAGVGTFIFAPVHELLLETYSWRGTVLIEAGILLNCVPFGMLFQSLNVKSSTRDKQKILNNNINEKEVNGGSTIKLNDSDAEMAKKPCESVQTLHSSEVQPNGANGYFEELERDTQMEPLIVTDVLALVHNEATDTVDEDPSTDHKDVILLPSDECTTHLKECDSSCAEVVVPPESKLMDFKLLLDIIFQLFAVSNFLINIAFVVGFIFLYDRGLLKDLSPFEAAFLVSIVGIANTLGRFVFGFLADYKCVDKLMLYNTVVVLCGIVTVFSFVCHDFVSLLIFAFLFGFLIGTYYIAESIFIKLCFFRQRYRRVV